MSKSERERVRHRDIERKTEKERECPRSMHFITGDPLKRLCPVHVSTRYGEVSSCLQQHQKV